jgi:hypothetical protein
LISPTWRVSTINFLYPWIWSWKRESREHRIVNWHRRTLEENMERNDLGLRNRSHFIGHIFSAYH